MGSAADSFSIPSPTTYPMKSRGAAEESATLRIDWRSEFTGGGLEADLSPPATVAVTASSARSVSSPAHPTKKGGGERVEMDWGSMFRAGRAEPPEAELSPSAPATVAMKCADCFSVTSPARTTKKSRALQWYVQGRKRTATGS
jgi:hypothetical protein